MRARSLVGEPERNGRIDRRAAPGNAVPAKVPGDRGWHRRSGDPDATSEERVRERAVVLHPHLAHAIARLTRVEIDVDRAVRRVERPEEAVRTDAWVVVDDLMRWVGEGINYPPIDIESDEAEVALVGPPVGAAEHALHEAHVGVEEQRLRRGAADLPGAGPVDARRSDLTVE